MNNKVLSLFRIACQHHKGVFYTPGHKFYGFDIYVFTEDGGYYLSEDETNALFEAEGFFYARSLFTGSLNDCLKHPNQFQSKIAQWLGLPAIDDNICEGIVIRPVTPYYLRTGSRALIKSKNEKFAEKKSVKRGNKQLEQQVEYSNELTELIGLLESFVNENRLANVVSHIGEVQISRDLGKLIKDMSYDVVEDFLKEYSALYNAIDKSEIKTFNKELNKKISSLVKKVYIQQNQRMFND